MIQASREDSFTMKEATTLSSKLAVYYNFSSFFHIFSSFCMTLLFETEAVMPLSPLIQVCLFYSLLPGLKLEWPIFTTALPVPGHERVKHLCLRITSSHLSESYQCIFILNNALIHWCFVKANTMWYGWPIINTLLTCACMVTVGINRSCLWTVYIVWVGGALSIQSKLACSIQSKIEANFGLNKDQLLQRQIR